MSSGFDDKSFFGFSCGVFYNQDLFKEEEIKKLKKLESNRKYREKNKEKIREQNKEYREKNKEKIAERKKIWYEKNREKAREISRNWSEKNKEKIAERKKIWYEKNREKVREKSKNWRKNNPEKMNECVRNWRKNNPEKAEESKNQFFQRNPDYYKKYHLKRKINKMDSIERETIDMSEKEEELNLQIEKAFEEKRPIEILEEKENEEFLKKPLNENLIFLKEEIEDLQSSVNYLEVECDCGCDCDCAEDEIKGIKYEIEQGIYPCIHDLEERAYKMENTFEKIISFLKKMGFK